MLPRAVAAVAVDAVERAPGAADDVCLRRPVAAQFGGRQHSGDADNAVHRHAHHSGRQAVCRRHPQHDVHRFRSPRVARRKREQLGLPIMQTLSHRDGDHDAHCDTRGRVPSFTAVLADDRGNTSG